MAERREHGEAAKVGRLKNEIIMQPPQFPYDQCSPLPATIENIGAAALSSVELKLPSTRTRLRSRTCSQASSAARPP